MEDIWQRIKFQLLGVADKKLPLNQSIPLGIQHVFAMFAGTLQFH